MNARYVSAYLRLSGLQDLRLNEYFQFIQAKTTSPNGVFALNFHVDTYAYWRDQDIDLLGLGFDTLYYVYRKDKWAQALSLAKAVRSGRWRASDRAVRDTSAAEIADSEILNALYNLSLHEEYYGAHLAQHVRRELCYEDYMASDTCFHEVLADNGIEHRDIRAFTSTLTIQRTEGDAQRIRDLLSHLGGNGPPSLPGR
jgi:LPS sulfotransferase NodH